jgi:ABC-type antimicrobial peptide transport system permease subunit
VGAFAGAALLLAALGVYGVIAYAVSQRQREIGMRLALGAAPGTIRRMMLTDGGRLAAIGLVLGVGGAIAGARLITGLLFGVEPIDLPTLVVVPVVLGIVTMIASWIPAQRAMRVDPLSAMREE